MSTVTRPRGPLPARVYWFRRLLLLVVAVLLVVGIAHLLGGGSGQAQSPGPAAAPVAGSSGSTSAAGDPSSAATPQDRPTGKGTAASAGSSNTSDEQDTTPTPLAEPTGPCDPSDVQITPTVRGNAYAGKHVRISLKMTTQDSPACTWKVSPQTVVLKLTSGSDRIWSTQDCPGAVPHASVVLRQGQVTRSRVTWNGQRSDETCSRTTAWAEPGYYHAEAAAFGADPVDQQFHLLPPPTPTITPTPTETSTKKPKHAGSESTGSSGGNASSGE